MRRDDALASARRPRRLPTGLADPRRTAMTGWSWLPSWRVTNWHHWQSDIIPVYRQVKCPLLVALATDDLPEQQPFHELYAAYRRGFEGRLAKASDANPCLRVTRVEGATHAMVAERPGEIARLITHFATPPTA